MKQYKFTSQDFTGINPEIDDAVLSPEDPINDIKRLAGITAESLLKPVAESDEMTANDHALSPVGSNISITGMEKQRLEKEHNIKPGTDAWFQLWCSKPFLTGEKPIKR
jgi:hypothetical protein